MICRMCLLDSSESLKIFADETTEYNIATTIAKHFWFEPKYDDPISNIVCNTCWWKIESFHVYYLSVEEAHRKLSERFSVKQESLHQRHTDAGIQVYLKLEQSNAAEDNDGTGGDGSEITVISVSEQQMLEQEGFDDEETVYNELVEASAVDSSQAEELHEEKEEAIKTESLETLSTHEALPERAVTRSRYLEAQKNLKEFIKIESVDHSLDTNDENDTSYSSPRVSQRCKRRKATTCSKEKPKEAKVRSGDYLSKSRDDDLKIAEHMKLKCDICGGDYPTFADVKRHYRNVHRRKGYVMCCNKKLYKRVLILDHVNKHLNPDYFKCIECNKVFADKQCLKNHMVRHESDEAKLFPCEHCSRRFTKQYLLDQHKLIHTPQDQRQYFCGDCGKAFPTNNLLQTHRRYVHENAYGQMCHICAKVIRGKRLFAKHQLEHAGVTEPKVQCEICGAWLKHAHSLKKHLLRHDEAHSEHVCNACGKVAPSKGALRSHIRYVHSSARSFKCSVCDKAFKKAIVLKEHMTTHTGEVLYTCPHCPKTFNSHANMHAHRKKVHRREWEEGRKNRGRPTESLENSGSRSDLNEMCEDSLGNLNDKKIDVILCEDVV